MSECDDMQGEERRGQRTKLRRASPDRVYNYQDALWIEMRILSTARVFGDWSVRNVDYYIFDFANRRFTLLTRASFFTLTQFSYNSLCDFHRFIVPR
jgi:hypothetical protein